MMTDQKRKITETDPDYEDGADQQAKRQRHLEKDARELACKKITTIIKREFQKEISDKEKELQQIDLRLNQGRLMMDRLRACVVASYYGRANRTLSSAPSSTCSTKAAPSNIHPAIKQYLGKAPKDHGLIESASSQDQEPLAQDSEEIRSEVAEVVPKSAGPAQGPSSSSHSSSSPLPFTSLRATKPVEANPSYDDRRLRFKIKKKIVIGNVSRYIPVDQRESTDMSSHKWMVYVRGPKSEPNISGFVKKVWFFLHHSYKPNDHVEINVPPFHLTRRGWGEFPVRVQLHFVDPRNKKVDIIHHLKLDQTFTGLQKLGAETVVEVELERDFFESDNTFMLKESSIVEQSRLLPRQTSLMQSSLLSSTTASLSSSSFSTSSIQPPVSSPCISSTSINCANKNESNENFKINKSLVSRKSANIIEESKTVGTMPDVNILCTNVSKKDNEDQISVDTSLVKSSEIKEEEPDWEISIDNLIGDVTDEYNVTIKHEDLNERKTIDSVNVENHESCYKGNSRKVVKRNIKGNFNDSNSECQNVEENQKRTNCNVGSSGDKSKVTKTHEGVDDKTKMKSDDEAGRGKSSPMNHKTKKVVTLEKQRIKTSVDELTCKVVKPPVSSTSTSSLLVSSPLTVQPESFNLSQAPPKSISLSQETSTASSIAHRNNQSFSLLNSSPICETKNVNHEKSQSSQQKNSTPKQKISLLETSSCMQQFTVVNPSHIYRRKTVSPMTVTVATPPKTTSITLSTATTSVLTVKSSLLPAETSLLSYPTSTSTHKLPTKTSLLTSQIPNSSPTIPTDTKPNSTSTSLLTKTSLLHSQKPNSSWVLPHKTSLLSSKTSLLAKTSSAITSANVQIDVSQSEPQQNTFTQVVPEDNGIILKQTANLLQQEPGLQEYVIHLAPGETLTDEDMQEIQKLMANGQVWGDSEPITLSMLTPTQSSDTSSSLLKSNPVKTHSSGDKSTHVKASTSLLSSQQRRKQPTTIIHTPPKPTIPITTPIGGKKQISLLTGLVVNSQKNEAKSQTLSQHPGTGDHKSVVNKKTNSANTSSRVASLFNSNTSLTQGASHAKLDAKSQVIVSKPNLPNKIINHSTSLSSNKLSLLSPPVSSVLVQMPQSNVREKGIVYTSGTHSKSNTVLAQTSIPNVVIAYPNTEVTAEHFESEIKMTAIGKTKRLQQQQQQQRFIKTGDSLVYSLHGDMEDRIKKQYDVLNAWKKNPTFYDFRGLNGRKLNDLNDIISGEADIVEKLNPEDYPDLSSLTKAAIRLHPLVQLGVNKLTHPYCAVSRRQWFSWPVGKQRASEWHRACFTLKYLKDCLNGATAFKGEKLFNTRQLVHWCRLHAFSPQIPVFLTTDLVPREEANATDEADNEMNPLLPWMNDPPQSFTKMEDLNSKLSASSRPPCVMLEDDDEVEITSEEPPNKKLRLDEIKEELVSDDDESNMESLPFSQGALFIHDLMRKRGLKLSPQKGQERLTADVLYQVMMEFGSDILRKTLSVHCQKQGPAEELSVRDVHSALCSFPTASFCRNVYLGKEEEDYSGGSADR